MTTPMPFADPNDLFNLIEKSSPAFSKLLQAESGKAPCSRYGLDPAQYTIAIAAYLWAYEELSGDWMGDEPDVYHSMASRIVNDSDDPAWTIREALMTSDNVPNLNGEELTIADVTDHVDCPNCGHTVWPEPDPDDDPDLNQYGGYPCEYCA